MIRWVILAAATILACELLSLLPLRRWLLNLVETTQKIRRVLSSKRISDHWKERVLPVYARQLASFSIGGFLILLLGLSPIFLVGFIWPQGWGAYLVALSSPLVILGLTAICMPYLWWRNRKRTSDQYSFGAKILHRLVLGTPILPEMLHDVEKTLYLKTAPDPAKKQHLFVAGLARAGTTVLMREIYGSGQFGSLTYDDMPFVLAPNLWSRLAGARKIEPHERAHGDGIKIDGQSPEALEEVFWRIHDGPSYLRPDRILPHRPDAMLLEDYDAYVRLVLRRTEKTRYLCKNNNNIVRIHALSSYFPDALILIPFRNPLDHAASLLRQHRRFSGTDSFTTAYMRWLGHHEFGDGHRPFDFGTVPDHDPDEIDYWLALWIQVYNHLAKIDRPNVRFVCFERLLEDPTYWERLAAVIGIPPGPLKEISARQPRDLPKANAALLDEAQVLYKTLSKTLGDS